LCSSSAHYDSISDSTRVIRVLYVDDEAGFLATTKKILELKGRFHVETALSVNEAVEKLSAQQFDVVVSDYQMPEKDGLVFLNELREKDSNIPFILFTGKGREEVAIKAMNLGADYYVNKVGHPETVYSQLTHYIMQAVNKRLAEERLKRKVALERVIARVSSRFVNPPDVDTAINESLADLGTVAGASRVYLFLLRDNGTVMDNTHEWCADGVTPQIGNLQNLPSDLFPWWMEQLRADRVIHIRDVSAMSPEAKVEKKLLESQDIKSLLVLPLYVAGELAGFIGFDNVERVDAWSSDDVFLLRIASDLVGSALERKRSEELYHALFENTGTAMVIIEDDMTISRVNKEFEQITGYAQEEVEGHNWTALVSEDYVKLMKKYHKERRTSGNAPKTYEFSFVHKNGETRTGLLTFELMPGSKRTVASIIDITERKKMEELLRESEEKYRLLAENTSDVVFIQDTNLRITYVSPSVKKLAGYTPEEVLELQVERLMTPESYRRGVEHFKEAFAKASEDPEYDVPLLEYEYFKKDGSTVWGEMKVKFLRDSDGRITGIQGTLRDITDRKKIETSLRREREMLELVTSNIGAVLTIISKDYQILWANSVITKQLGEVKGKPCFSTYNDRKSVCAGCGVKKIFETGAEYAVHEQLVPTDKGPAWFEIVTTPIKNEKGEIVAAIEVSIDVTERKKTESKLKETKKRFEEYLNLSRSLMVALDSKGYITYVNKRFCEVAGCSEEDAVGKNWFTTFVPEHARKEVQCIFKRVMNGETGPEEQHENPLLTLHGEERIISWKNAVLRNADGKPVGALSSGEDITERKRMEKRLREAESRYRAIFDKSPLGILIIDLDGVAVEFNEEAHRQLGYTREEFAKLTVSDYEVIETPEETRAHMQRILKTGKEEFETKYRTKTGEIRDVVNTVQVIEIDGKKFFHVVTQDITERKNAERALKIAFSELELHDLEILALLNASRAILDQRSFTDSAKHIYDSAKSLIGAKAGYVALLNEDGTESKILFMDTGNRHYDAASHMPMPTKEFREKMRLTDTPIYDNNFSHSSVTKVFPHDHPVLENLLFAPLVIEDHTLGVIALANKPGGFNDGDSQRILAFSKLAAIALKNSQTLQELENSRRRAEAMSEKLAVVGRLTRHDVLNKLSIIANNLYLVKQTLGSPDAQSYLQDVESTLEHIEKIFSFASTYEKVGVEKLSYINVEQSFNEAASLFSGTKAINLVNECHGLSVLADSLLRQIFYNLIDDSLKHGETVTEIRVLCKEGDGYLNLVYEDNGVGISTEQKELIFKEGYGKGTGYGLYLIQKICETYGWTIRETGKPGEGAQFTMVIPKEQNGQPSYVLKTASSD